MKDPESLRGKKCLLFFVFSAGVDRYSIEENISGNSRPPKSAISSQIHACENALLDLNLNPDFRAATNCGAPVTRPALRYSLFQGIPPTINFVAEGEKSKLIISPFFTES